MSTSSVVKQSRKYKKSEARADITMPEGEVSNPKKVKTFKDRDGLSLSTPSNTGATLEADQLSSLNGREKKSKHRKHADGQDVIIARQVDDSTSTKKKRKHEAPVSEDAKPAVDVDTSHKKKEKRKAKKVLAEGDVEDTREVEVEAKQDETVDSVEVDVAAPSKATSQKDKKKRKKDADDVTEVADAESSRKEKKRRHRSSAFSEFPDPGQDDALNDQARKALQYAYSQFDDPVTWKFHKARQNWLIRNIWSQETVPELYIPLVSRYLQGVQGGVRDTLLKSCREALESSNSPPDEESALSTELSQSANESTERTVKFVVDTENPTTSSNEIKKQRATTLLQVLTSNAS